MKSKVLKIRNLPEDMQILNEVKVKPIGTLIFLLLVSGLFIFSGSTVAVLGVVLLAVSIYALLVMPDRILMQFTEDFVVLYNRKSRDECMLIYWDEIMRWQYQKHNNEDMLILHLIDGQTEAIECFNRNRTVSYFKIFAKDKEIENRSCRRHRVETQGASERFRRN